MGKTTKIFSILTVILAIAFGGWASVRIVKFVSFDIKCADHIKRAANASSIEMAKEELSKAIEYAEENNLTEGIIPVSMTSDRARNDIGVWYQRLKTAYKGLDNLPKYANALEEMEVLMELRNSLTKINETRIYVVVPDGIDIYPYNVAFYWWGMISGLALWLLILLKIILNYSVKC